MNNRLYVANLGPNVTDASLRELFSGKGEVQEVELLIDPGTGRSIGRAYVTMATPDVAAAAMTAFHSHSLDGRYITVTEARPVEEKPAGQIGQGFEVYKSPEQKQNHGGQRNNRHHRHNGGNRKNNNNNNKRRFPPSR